ncbi:MAG: DUF2269 domain-containing protein [Actinomycetota bacterium]
MLTLHLFSAVGWIGAIVAYIAVNIAALTSSSDTIVRGAFLILKPMLIYAITPLALTALTTGIVLALVTPWGLLRHRWVVASLWLTGLAVVLLVAHINGDDITELTNIANDTSKPASSNLGDLPNAIGGLVLVSIAFVLNVYKPRGLTKRGKQLQEIKAKTGQI